jgi:hypothetical protein
LAVSSFPEIDDTHAAFPVASPLIYRPEPRVFVAKFRSGDTVFTEPFDEQDGYRIWLDLSETGWLLQHAMSRKEYIAFALGRPSA